MGVDAVVYRNKNHLELGPDEDAAQLVGETGEVYFEDEGLARKYRNQIKAVEFRLGNIAEISALKTEVSRLIGPESLLVQRILCSGTHSGSVVPLQSLSTLSTELKYLKGTSKQSDELRRFLASLEELVQSAMSESNPIVFT